MKKRIILLASVVAIAFSANAHQTFCNVETQSVDFMKDGGRKKIGKATGVLFSLDGVEYITYVPVKKKEAGKKLTKISFPIFPVDKEVGVQTNNFVVAVYDHQKQLVHTENVHTSSDLVEVTLSDVALKKEGFYVGIKFVGTENLNAKKKYNFYFKGDATYKSPTFYKLNSEQQWKSLNDIEDEDFEKMYQFASEHVPMFKKRKNLSPIFEIEWK